MERNEDEIVKYIEPVFGFCVKRVSNRHDAEDLASEIMVHILNGVKKYRIDSLEKWVWRIAHNRYARFINMRNKRGETLSENDFIDVCDDYDFVDKLIIADEYQQVFKCLHTLSCEYRNILVDYYIEQLPVKQIAGNYGLSETTVKWRLNIGRKKIKTGIGETKMDKIYKRINWNTGSVNGGWFNPNNYLERQTARAICEAAYEMPLTVEEISLKTGLPAMYIEDELPKLINGEAIIKEGNKYAANFVVLRLCDRQAMVTKFPPLVSGIADYFTEIFNKSEDEISKMDFYGSQFRMKRLGYIALPITLREKIKKIKDGLDMKDGPYPPRLDGGFGWFHITETVPDNEPYSDYSCGLYISAKNPDDDKDLIYYATNGKYYNSAIPYGDLNLIYNNKIVNKSEDGYLPDNALTDDDKVTLIKNNLVVKDGNRYKLNFPIFDGKQYDRFIEYFNKAHPKIDGLLTELITGIHKSFTAFTPKHLNSQINQWVTCYVENITGFVMDDLINRGVLEKPENEKPLPNGVFCVLGGNVIEV